MLVILLLHQLGDDDFESIDDTELLIGMILEQLELFGTDEQIRKWRNELFMGTIDYTNRELVIEWYATIKRQYGPRLEGHESCINEIPLFMGVPDSLPQYDTLTICGWCTR